MLLLFASCLNCSVHGAFLFCGEKLLQFIVKYKAVSVRFGGDRGTSHLPARRTPGSRLALQKVLENGDIWECCDPGNSPRCGTDSVGVQHWPLGDVSGWALCLFMKIIILIKFIFFFFFGEQIVSSYLEWSLWKVRVEEQIMFTAILKKETWLFFVKCIFDWLIFTCDLLTRQMEIIFRWTKC